MWKIGEAGTSIAMTMVMEAVCLRMAAATALSVMAMVAFQANFRGGGSFRFPTRLSPPVKTNYKVKLGGLDLKDFLHIPHTAHLRIPSAR